MATKPRKIRSIQVDAGAVTVYHSTPLGQGAKNFVGVLGMIKEPPKTDVHLANDQLRSALLSILDAVDYTNRACGPTEMVGAVLPKILINNARKAILSSYV